MKIPARISLGLLAGIFLFVLLLNALAAWGECAWYGHQTQRDTRFSIGVGCMAKVEDRWIPRNELRVLQ